MKELTEAAGALDSPEDVSRVHGKIFMALLEDRISLKKAGMLGFLGQVLLGSHREIAFYKKPHMESEEQEEKEKRNRIWQQEQDLRRR